ncbi:MAG: cytochrome c peroxidase [Brumimicrobium sp.]|nr:cytochrome c peroxidase [Brumimicrobium sp.]
MKRSIFYILIVLTLLSCRNDKITRSLTPYKLDIPSHFPDMPIPEDNPMSVEGVELGRKLFYEKMLSRDNSISCGACHSPQAAFSDPNQFSVGVDEQIGTRNSMALINLGWQTSFFWDGRAKTLEEQILEPVPAPHEMDQSWSAAISKLNKSVEYNNDFFTVFGVEKYDSTHVAKAIAQFLRTMISGKSKYDVMYKVENSLPLTAEEQAVWQSITVEEIAGRDLFFSLSAGDCLHCHSGALAQVNKFSNNGLDATFSDPGRMGVTGNPNDAGKFKVPTLRNIEFSAPYMHDGRFSTLEEVVNHYSSGVVTSPTIDPMIEFAFQGGVQLDPQQKELIVTFLKTFSDHEFINNPDFQDPH